MPWNADARRLGERLLADPPADPEPGVVHSDFYSNNWIFRDGDLAAVLDWEMVTAGDPVQDLAWYLLIDHHHTLAFEVPRLPGLPPLRCPISPMGEPREMT